MNHSTEHASTNQQPSPRTGSRPTLLSPLSPTTPSSEARQTVQALQNTPKMEPPQSSKTPPPEYRVYDTRHVVANRRQALKAEFEARFEAITMLAEALGSLLEA